MPKFPAPTPGMAVYVLGFLLTEDRQLVVLQTKSHPEWQQGKLNGIGGKVQEGESPAQAMAREAEEEADVRPDWDLLGMITGPGWMVYVYRAFDDRAALHARGMEDEPLSLVAISSLPSNIIPNLAHLVPLAAHYEGVTALIEYAS